MSMNFGLVTAPRSGSEWVRTAQDAEAQGYSVLLLPDTLYTPSPLPALAAAAAVTERIRLRPNVLAAPLRTPAATAREVSALQLLSDGRFELGLGSGRPDAAGEAEKLGVAWGSAGQRRQQLVDVIVAVRATVRPAPPIVLAASGPRMLATAAELADRIHLAVQPAATEQELAGIVATVRDHTDRPIAFSLQLVGIGEQLPYFMSKHLGVTIEQLRAADSAALLPADPGAAAELLEYRREKYGIDELLVPAELARPMAPVLARFR
ncbi:LLM class flavin-dependent oxidoreductase [Nocardia yamanashiensis]|uniref:LLM class flavin-dependent oxidoreductase n=1 Tax=Nocardia yamanashiensis TaxID=209247 RepID=UPI000B06A52A|nr:LLM class flavin-dependent oxidoreductase [Nocardia yamanashiensis]